jgi:hypothetical protein
MLYWFLTILFLSSWYVCVKFDTTTNLSANSFEFFFLQNDENLGALRQQKTSFLVNQPGAVRFPGGGGAQAPR